MDGSGSLSFAIRGIPSSIRPPNRHSGEGRNPEGVGSDKTTRRWKKPARQSIFMLLCGLRKAMVIPACYVQLGVPIAWGLVPDIGTHYAPLLGSSGSVLCNPTVQLLEHCPSRPLSTTLRT